MKRLLAVGLFAAAILSAAPASADSLTLTSLGKGEWVSVTRNGATVTGWAGEGNWLLSTTGFTGNIYAYCVDLFDDALTVQNPITVKTTDQLNSTTTPFVNPLDLTAGARAAWLFNTYSTSIHSAAGTAAQAAGLQLAIWETLYPALYPSNVFNFTASAAATTWANTYLGTLGTNTSVATFLDAAKGKGQDQITRVPEPATVLLCLLALPLLFVFRRRRVAA